MAHPLDLPPLPHEMVLFAGDDAYWPVVLDPDFMWDFFQHQEVGDVNAFQQVPLDEEDFWGEDLEEEDGEDSDRDSGYESLSEDEEEEEEEEVNVRDQWDPPAEAEEHAPQPTAEILYPDFIPLHEDPNFIPLHEVRDQWDPSAEAEAPAPQPTAEILYPDFIPLEAPSGSKHPRDEEEDEEEDDGPSAKRTCWSSTEDRPEDPGPSTSAGTSGGFTRYFHTFWDPDDD